MISIGARLQEAERSPAFCPSREIRRTVLYTTFLQKSYSHSGSPPCILSTCGISRMEQQYELPKQNSPGDLNDKPKRIPEKGNARRGRNCG
jgi:hypothetical protein